MKKSMIYCRVTTNTVVHAWFQISARSFFSNHQNPLASFHAPAAVSIVSNVISPSPASLAFL